VCHIDTRLSNAKKTLRQTPKNSDFQLDSSGCAAIICNLRVTLKVWASIHADVTGSLS
jgi:hypothetical protein